MSGWRPAIVIAFTVAVALAACQPVVSSDQNDTAALVPLTGTEWFLDEMDGEQLGNESIVTAQFQEDGTLVGSAGCNDYSTTYEIDGAELIIDPAIQSTMMECEEAVMTVESLYLATLQRTSSHEIEAEVLFIRDGDGTVTLVFEAGAP